MSSRISGCQKRCAELIKIFDRRVQLDTNTRVKGIQDDLMGLFPIPFIHLPLATYKTLQRRASRSGWMHPILRQIITLHAKNISQGRELGFSMELHFKNGRIILTCCYGSMAVVCALWLQHHTQLTCFDDMYSWVWQNYYSVRLHATLFDMSISIDVDL